MSDISDIKKNTDILQVVGRYVHLKQDGPHWVAKCPFPDHQDDSASFKITPSKKQAYKCFGCGRYGDVFDFLVDYSGKTFKEALEYLKDPNNTAALPYLGKSGDAKSFKAEKKINWKPTFPVVMENDAKMFHHYKYGMASKWWAYKNEKGDIIGFAVRFDLPGDKKEVLPLTYCVNDSGYKMWRWLGSEKPRKLHNLDKIASTGPEVPILIVEGEKTVKAAEKFFLSVVATCWWGGADGVKSADWSVLKGRTVVLWPDNDMPGFKAMHTIYELIKDIAADIKWTQPPSYYWKGWDLADADDWDVKAARDYSSKNTIDYPGADHKWISNEDLESNVLKNVLQQSADHSKKKAEKKELEAKIPPANTIGPHGGPPDGDNPEDPYREMGMNYFKMLGAQKEGNGMTYYFYSVAFQTVIGLVPSAMTKNNIMQLAPLNWWRNSFHDNKGMFEADRGADYLINASSRKGIFTDSRIRGRGAWVDNKRIVVHTGDKLLVNGKETALNEIESKFIYEVGNELGLSVTDPLKAAESSKFITMLSKLNWLREVDAYLLAGWIVVAPICGALSWRPHIWLTGPSGTGKSTIVQDVIKFMLGPAAIDLQGETSEPGIRQKLGRDARPVLFDESEGEDQKALARMQSVLGFARASSTANGGEIAKGAPGGGAGKSYIARSCFAFASIVPLAKQQADVSRISGLTLVRSTPETAGRWAEFQKLYAGLITEEYSRALRARTISIIPNILANAKTFSRAAATLLGEQRTGDQLGALLSGAYSLVNNGIIEYEEALEWVKKRDWTEERNSTAEKDEVLLMKFLLQQQLRIETRGGAVERPIGELVLVAMNMISAETDISPGHADERLKRHGMRVKDGYLYISNSDFNVTKMLEKSNWPRNHNKILIRLAGAVPVDSVRFASGAATRAVKIPKNTLFGDDFSASDTLTVTAGPDTDPPIVDITKDKGLSIESNDIYAVNDDN